MIDRWLGDLVQATRLLGVEADRVEVKVARGGLPDSAKESVCAFANTPTRAWQAHHVPAS